MINKDRKKPVYVGRLKEPDSDKKRNIASVECPGCRTVHDSYVGASFECALCGARINVPKVVKTW